MSLCARCKVELTDENGFRRKSGPKAGNFMGYCRGCSNSLGANWRKENPDKVRQKSAEQRRVFALRISQIKEGQPCHDCEGMFPEECMDFDHLRDKKFSIGNSGACRKWSSVLEEIAKCDLVCANCHRIRTKKRLCPTPTSNP